jgi:hypothetical protein
MFMRDLPFIPLLYYSSHSLVSPKLKGWEDNLQNVHPDASDLDRAERRFEGGGGPSSASRPPLAAIAQGALRWLKCATSRSLSRSCITRRQGRGVRFSMFGYVTAPSAGAIPTLFLIVTGAFFLMRVAPGGPFDLERTLEAKVMENLNRIYHLDKPLWEQYLYYLGNLARGDFGPSFVYRDFSVRAFRLRPAGLDPARRGGAGAGAGRGNAARDRLAALRQNRPADYGIAGGDLGITIPNFRDRAGPVAGLSASGSAGCRPAAGATPQSYNDPAGRHAGPAANRGRRPADARRDDRGDALRPCAHRARLRPAGPHGGRRACAARRDPAGGLLCRPGGGGAADRLGRGRDDLRPARHRALFRPGRAQPRLHAGDGHGDRSSRSSSSSST